MHSVTSLRIYFSVPNKVHKYSMAKRTCRFAISENQCCHRQHKRELLRNFFDTTYHKLTESSSSYRASKTAGRVQDFKPLRIFSFDFVVILISTYVLKLQALHCHSLHRRYLCLLYQRTMRREWPFRTRLYAWFLTQWSEDLLLSLRETHTHFSIPKDIAVQNFAQTRPSPLHILIDEIEQLQSLLESSILIKGTTKFGSFNF